MTYISSINRNYFLVLFSNFFLFLASLLTALSIYTSFFSWFFFILFLILILIKTSENIYKENKRIFYLILTSFFLKFFINEFIYVYFELRGYPLGTIGGSDDISYFLKGKLIAQLFINDLSAQLNPRIYHVKISDNQNFYLFNALINLIDIKISLKEMIKVGIIINAFSAVIFYHIYQNIRLNKNYIFLFVFLFVIDLKIFFYSNLNLKEIYLLFSFICCIYLSSVIITNNLNNKKILALSIFGLLFSAIIRWQFFLIYLFMIIVSIYFRLILIIKNNYILKLFNLSIFLGFFLLIFFYYEDVYNYIIIYNNQIAENFLTPNENLSLGNKIFSLKLADNIFYIFIYLGHGILGIFPIFKVSNLYFEFQKIAQVWFHLLLIASTYHGFRCLKNLNKNNLELTFFTITVTIGVFIIILLCALVTYGSLEFSRYSLSLNLYFLIIIAISIKNLNINFIFKIIGVYVVMNLILLIPYYYLKSLL